MVPSAIDCTDSPLEFVPAVDLPIELVGFLAPVEGLFFAVLEAFFTRAVTFFAGAVGSSTRRSSFGSSFVARSTSRSSRCTWL
jgi:hypothetical protein